MRNGGAGRRSVLTLASGCSTVFFVSVPGTVVVPNDSAASHSLVLSAHFPEFLDIPCAPLILLFMPTAAPVFLSVSYIGLGH